MSVRSKGHLGLLLVAVVLLAVVLVGCGSSSSSESSTTTKKSATSGSVAVAGGSEDGMVGKKLQPTSETPPAYTEALEQGRAVVLLFYVPGGSDDAKVLAAVQTLQPSFSNYTFLFYNYKDPSAYGDLSTLLDVDYPPELVLVRADGTVKAILNGYRDQGSINQELVNLGTG
jgi:hypothetical protein